MRIAPIGPPVVRDPLVLAMPRARPRTRLVRDTSTLLAGLDFVTLNRSRAW